MKSGEDRPTPDFSSSTVCLCLSGHTVRSVCLFQTFFLILFSSSSSSSSWHAVTRYRITTTSCNCRESKRGGNLRQLRHCYLHRPSVYVCEGTPRNPFHMHLEETAHLRVRAITALELSEATMPCRQRFRMWSSLPSDSNPRRSRR